MYHAATDPYEDPWWKQDGENQVNKVVHFFPALLDHHLPLCLGLIINDDNISSALLLHRGRGWLVVACDYKV